MLEVRLEANAINIGRHFAVDFQPTLRIPDGGMQIIVFDPKPGKFSDAPNLYDARDGIWKPLP